MPKQPNFLIIMTDEHAASYSGTYMHPVVQTPCIDGLAERGAVFEAAYCNSPLCVPSRMSFMTGSYVHSIGTWDNGTPLASDTPTWAHRLRKAGYEVALAGKMHFIGPDQRHGFNRRLVEDCHDVTIETPDWERPVPFSPERFRARVERAGEGRTKFIDYDREVAAKSIEYLEEKAREKDTPFALCVGFYLPHFPLVCEPKYYRQYYPDYADLPANTEPSRHPALATVYEYFGLTEPFAEDHVRRARAAYYGLITFVDELVGQLLTALDELGLREDTIVVYTSDHGEMLGERGLWWKCQFFEQAVRVPLIIAGPRVEPGQRRREVVSLVDLTATILDLAGADMGGSLDGRSMRGLLNGQEQSWVNRAFAEYHAHGTRHSMFMLRRDNLKFNFYGGGLPCQLFDLDSDPEEECDLAWLPEYAEVRESMYRELLETCDPLLVETEVRRSQWRRRLVAKGEYNAGTEELAETKGR